MYLGCFVPCLCLFFSVVAVSACPCFEGFLGVFFGGVVVANAPGALIEYRSRFQPQFHTFPSKKGFNLTKQPFVRLRWV